MSTEPTPPQESFASLFESDARSRPRKGAGRGYAVGQTVEGTVVRVGKDSVFIDLDGKREGYLASSELVDPDGTLNVKIGDVVRAVIVAMHGDAAMQLGKVAPKGRGAEGLVQAMHAGLPVEGLVTGVNKGGLEVTVDNVRAFCPARQVDVRFVADLNAYVGQKLEFLVAQVKEGGREVVLSRRAALERKTEEARAQLESKLVAGAVLTGKVSSTREFGAFVDLGGVEGLLPASELSHDRSLRPDDVVKVGDEVTVQILRVEPSSDARKGGSKITLSLKALAADPWESVAPTLQEGSVREGRVVRIAPFGAFVQLAPGLDGLLHISEIGGEIEGPGGPSLPQVGATIGIRILKVDLAARRIALAPADAPERARTQPKAQPQAVRQGMVVRGKVSGVEKFGVFVQLDGGVGRGLLPAAELTKTRSGDLHKHFPLGMELSAKVVAVDAAGKIRLSVEAMRNDEERASFEDFRAREQERSSKNLGALGQKLQAAGLLNTSNKKR